MIHGTVQSLSRVHTRPIKGTELNMGKRKQFIDKKNARHFKLVPSYGSAPTPGGKKFVPTQEQLEEQQKFGIFFDDDYDYMQHLRGVNEGFTLQSLDEDVETEIIKAPRMPPMPLMMFGEGSSSKPKKEIFDADVDRALEGEFDEAEGDLDDDFITQAGGIVEERFIQHRNNNTFSDESENEEDFDDNYEDYEDDLDEEDPITVDRDGPKREIDQAFDHLLEADYNEDQMGELDGDDDNMGGFIEPDDGRLHRLANEKRGDNEYDEELAKEYVRKRMALIESGVLKEDETEIVEVEESTKKRMKWDCESFATQYSNIYNHPTLIKDAPGKLSRKALKRLDREHQKEQLEEMEEDVEMDDDDNESTYTTVSTFRPKGETSEERKLRKQAVKEARRSRREEKKGNKVAFAEEKRKVANARVGQIKSVPIV